MKNTLAMVQAIATQTFRQAATIEEGRIALTSRLTALSQAQDILTQTNWKQANIRTIVESALLPHRTGENRIHIEGNDADLTAQQGVGLSLALHELATNAAKYGALSNDSGQIAIGWTVSTDESFVFIWQETGGQTVQQPTRSGFGSRLIERIIAPYFQGTSSLAFQPEGVIFHLTGSL